MLPVVIPLRLFLGQLFCLCVGLAIESTLLLKRAELPRQIAFHYTLIANVVAVSVGWLVLFAGQGLLFNGVREQQLLSYLFTGEFIPDVSMASTQFTCAMLAIILFLGGLLIKPYSIRLLQRLEILPLPPNANLGTDDPRLNALVLLRLRERIEGSIQIGHVLSTLATMIFFLVASTSLWL
jgi:hypothetical protein